MAADVIQSDLRSDDLLLKCALRKVGSNLHDLSFEDGLNLPENAALLSYDGN